MKALLSAGKRKPRNKVFLKKDIFIMVQCYLIESGAGIHLGPVGVKVLTKNQPEHGHHLPGVPLRSSSLLCSVHQPQAPLPTDLIFTFSMPTATTQPSSLHHVSSSHTQRLTLTSPSTQSKLLGKRLLLAQTGPSNLFCSKQL